MSKQKDNIKAVNQDFSQYDQVEKKQVYHLSEIEGEDQFDDDYIIQQLICLAFEVVIQRK